MYKEGKFHQGNGEVHNLIRKIIKRHKCLRLYEIHQKLMEHGHWEGDTGRRLREMEDIRCDRIYNSKEGKTIWLYSFTTINKSKMVA